MAEYIFTNLPQYIKLNSRSEFSSSVVSSGAVLLFSEDGYTLTGKLPDGSFITIGGSGSGGTDVSDTTATAATVLGGYAFYNSAGVKTSGTIPTVSATSSGSQITVPAGYIADSQTFNVSGGVDVGSTTAEAADVLSGKIFYNSAGVQTSGTIQTLGSSSYTPTTSDQVISSGVYLGGNQTIAGDSNLVGSNILSGVSIFGVPGTLVTSSGAEVTLGYINETGQFQPLTFSGTSAYDSGSAAVLSCYGWNLPVSSGGSWTSSGTVLNSGMTSSVMSAETWIDTTINSGGTLTVSNGGTANETYIFGGDLEISSGGIANSTTITSRRVIVVSSGGTANNTTVNVDGWMEVKSGGTATSITVNSNGTLNVSGGTANEITVNSHGNGFVSAGGIVNNLILNGNQDYNQFCVYSGGTAFGTTVNSGSYFCVYSDGTANNTTVNSSGAMLVRPGCRANNIIVSSGGTLYISAGAITSNITSMTGAVIINA